LLLRIAQIVYQQTAPGCGNEGVSHAGQNQLIAAE